MAQKAQCTAYGDGKHVLYRNLRTDATLLLKPGDAIPRGGEWKPLASDSVPRPVNLYFGKGPVWQSSGAELNDGDQINIEMDHGFSEGNYRSGLYEVDQKQCLSDQRFSFVIRRIGDIDPKKLIHLAVLIGC